VYRYQPQPKPDEPIQTALRQLAARKPRWGFKKIYQYLRNQGQPWNHKRVHRIYVELGLNLRRKAKKRLPVWDPRPLVVPAAANVSWSLDFMPDSLANGRPIRTLNILDDFNREALWIEVNTSIPSMRVSRVLGILALWGVILSSCGRTMAQNSSRSNWRPEQQTTT
jgi:putative transposase